MQVYTQTDDLIERWQWNDPALRHLDAIVLDLLRGERGRVLDLGCGSGRLAANLALAGFSVDGIDAAEHVVAIGRKIMTSRGLDVRLYAGDALEPEPPIAKGGYDAVVCTEVLEHVEYWRELLDGAGRLLRPGGLLVVSVPRDPGQFSALDSYAGHLRRFRDTELLAALRGEYTEIDTRWFGWPMLRSTVWLYTRWLARSGRAHAQQSQTLWREAGPRRRLAIALGYQLLKLDRLFAHVPLGTTLVVRARKRR